MACVVNMVRKYSGCTVRTLIRVPSGGATAANAAPADALKTEVQRTLTGARIDSVIETVVLDAKDATPKTYDVEVCKVANTILYILYYTDREGILTLVYMHQLHLSCLP